MKWLIVFFFGFTSILLFTAVLSSLLFTDKRLKKRMKHYLINQGDKPFDKKRFNLLLQLQLYNQSILRKIPLGKKTDQLELLLTRAGVPLTPGEFIVFRWIATLLFGGIMYLILGKIVGFFIGISLGYMFPKWSIQRKQQKRLQKFNNGLSDMITVIIGSLRAGFSFPQSLKSVVEESDSPIQEEIDLVLKEMQYGNSLEDALNQLLERMPSGDLDLMIQAILIQRQVGGNLATVLETIVQTIRDRNTIQRQVSTLTAQGKLSGIVIGLLPLVLGGAIYLISPEYVGTLFTHKLGIILLSGGIVSGIIGFILIRKLTTIEV